MDFGTNFYSKWVWKGLSGIPCDTSEVWSKFVMLQHITTLFDRTVATGEKKKYNFCNIGHLLVIDLIQKQMFKTEELVRLVAFS